MYNSNIMPILDKTIQIFPCTIRFFFVDQQISLYNENRFFFVDQHRSQNSMPGSVSS